VGQDVLTAPSDLKINNGVLGTPFFMISSDTPYKLAEIIRDTWPQLYRHLRPANKFGRIYTQLHDKNNGR